MVTESDVNKFVSEVEKVTKQKEMDLSSDADLSVAIMNLVNLEEHLFFTAVETGNDDYYDPAGDQANEDRAAQEDHQGIGRGGLVHQQAFAHSLHEIDGDWNEEA